MTGHERLLPRKGDYRQRAHCNPLSDSYVVYPPSPEFVNWSVHYPKKFGRSDITTSQFNTTEHPISYPERVGDALNGRIGPRVEILDVGCGYGGLMMALAPIFPETLILGMEIREKVTTYVGCKINALRRDESLDHKFDNVAVLKTNVMKFLINYFRKGQISKMFFCFPDPHFKRSNARRRIIGPSLLTSYAYVLKEGGHIYTVTDVEDLHIWMRDSLRAHPLFKEIEITDELRMVDKCIDIMETQTEEGKKGHEECYNLQGTWNRKHANILPTQMFLTRPSVASTAAEEGISASNSQEFMLQWPKVQCLTGSTVALVTPMKDDKENSIDLESLKELVYWHIKSGTKGILVMGTTGENPTVTDDEFKEIISAVVEYARDASGGVVPVIAGSGTNCTRTAIVKTKLVQSLGADAALVVTPWYNKPTQEGLIQHFSAVAKACADFPIFLYNVPGRTGCDILPSTVAVLAKLPNIIGTKEASGRFERYAQLGELCPKGFRIFSGEDDQTVPAILSGTGVVGVMSVTANVAPTLVQKGCELALQKKDDAARSIHDLLLPLHEIMFVETSPSPVKYILATNGKIPAGIRLPLVPLSSKNQESVFSTFQLILSKSGNF